MKIKDGDTLDTNNFDDNDYCAVCNNKLQLEVHSSKWHGLCDCGAWEIQVVKTYKAKLVKVDGKVGLKEVARFIGAKPSKDGDFDGDCG